MPGLSTLFFDGPPPGMPPTPTSIGREVQREAAVPPPPRRSDGPRWPGQLADLVRVGDGVARETVLRTRAEGGGQGGAITRWLGQLAEGVGRGVLCLSALAAWGLGRIERRAEQGEVATDRIRALADPPPDTVFHADRPRVIDRLVVHARHHGKTEAMLTKADLDRLVAVGEHVVARLYRADSAQAAIEALPPSPYIAKAVSWYMMACAAHQDLQRAGSAEGAQDGLSDMADAGAFMMNDPGRRLYDYLSAVPTCSARMSTHVSDLSAQDRNHQILGLVRWNAPAQQGIEDYQATLPGEGGNLLFDTLRPGQGSDTPRLFVKFEHAGCPAYFHARHDEGTGTRVVRFVAALWRNFRHVVNFSHTRDIRVAESAGRVNRHEHVYKGYLRSLVADPFRQLVRDAIDGGFIEADARAMGKHMKAYGLPFVKAAVAQVRARVQEVQRPASAGDEALAVNARAERMLARCTELETAIAEAETALGRTSAQWGIERRGAEVHIGLRPEHARAPGPG